MNRVITELEAELKLFRHAPETLIADVVLHGFASDVHESAAAVEHLVESQAPVKAYPNARLAFEGAQNALVLATHERYERAGALAWAYFDWKDREWQAELANAGRASTLTPDEWLDARIQEVADVWNDIAPGHGDILLDALRTVRHQARLRPDNWLRENMTTRQDRAYVLLAARHGKPFDQQVAPLNRKIYLALCRETHARPRLDALAFRYDRGTGLISVEVLPRDVEKAKKGVIDATKLSVEETIQALRWRQRAG